MFDLVTRGYFRHRSRGGVGVCSQRSPAGDWLPFYWQGQISSGGNTRSQREQELERVLLALRSIWGCISWGVYQPSLRGSRNSQHYSQQRRCVKGLWCPVWSKYVLQALIFDIFMCKFMELCKSVFNLLIQMICSVEMICMCQKISFDNWHSLESDTLWGYWLNNLWLK